MENLPRISSTYGRRNEEAPRSGGDCGAFPELHSTQASSPSTAPLTKRQRCLHESREFNIAVSTSQVQRFEPEQRGLQAETASNDIKRTMSAISSGETQHSKKSLTMASPKYFKYAKVTLQEIPVQSRVIKLQEVISDPLDPASHRLKKMPTTNDSTSRTAVYHSPPRTLTKKDLDDWSIPPSVSNWKNSKGYMIPLDKRLAADGRGLQTTLINDSFAKLSEALYVAEQKSRDAVDVRAKLQTEIRARQDQKNEDSLRKIAAQAKREPQA